MTMTRREQIEEAADHYIDIELAGIPIDEVHCESVFIQGAEWADKNPAEPSRSANIRNKIIKRLEAQLTIAVEALTKIEPKPPGCDAAWFAKEALGKIEAIK